MGPGGQDALCGAEWCVVTRQEEHNQVDVRKYKAGLLMSQRRLSPQKIQEIRDLAAQWGKIVARRAFGEAGPGTQVDFRTLEQVAAAAAAGLTEGTLATLLEQQAQALGTEAPCPDCGRPCLLDYEDRPLAVQGGHLTLHEPVCHCPDCRRDFFPPAGRAAPGQPRLQPDPLTEDH